MQVQQNRKKTTKGSKSAQSDLNNPLSSQTQDQSQQQTAGNHQKWQENQEYTNLVVNEEKIEEFKSYSCSYQAQNLSLLLKVAEDHSKNSNRRELNIFCKDTAGTAQVLLESGKQLRGEGGEIEAPFAEEVQNQHLTGLLHKIDEYKRRIQSSNNFEIELGTYITPVGKLNRNHEDSVREPFELELEIKKRLLHPDSDLKVLLLTGEAGVGKSSFCK